jgi:hypothetical protein
MSTMENDQNQGKEHKNESPCWGPEQWAQCCSGISSAEDACSGSKAWPDMTKCFGFCHYFLLLPVVLGISFLVLGYYLGPEVIRLFWMIGAGMVVGMGLLAALAMRRFTTGSGFSGCCGTWAERKTSGKEVP